MISAKKIVVIVAIISIATISIAGTFKLVNDGVITLGQLEDSSSSKIINVTLIIDYGDGRVDEFKVNINSKNATVYSVLMKAANEHGFDVDADYYPNFKSHYIKSINQTEEDPKTNKFWQYYVNGVYGKVGADLMKVNDGDIIEWKYEEPRIGNMEG